MGPIRRPSHWSLGSLSGHLSGHLGSTVSALVDGQLDAEEAERAWQHVSHCPPCRRLVEHEGWVKSRLAGIAEAPRGDEPPAHLVGCLRGLDATALAWSDTQEIEDRARTRRRVGIAAVGAGSVSAAVLGLATLGGAPAGPGPATISRTTPSPGATVVAPIAVVHGRLTGLSVTRGGAAGAGSPRR